MNVHRVKSWPEYFEPIWAYEKNFDLRRDDRGYEVGDEITFEEFRPSLAEYTGRTCRRTISYILRNFEGLQFGYCILSLTGKFPRGSE